MIQQNKKARTRRMRHGPPGESYMQGDQPYVSVNLYTYCGFVNIEFGLIFFAFFLEFLLLFACSVVVAHFRMPAVEIRLISRLIV